MPTTPLGFPYPSDSDYASSGADVPRAVQDLADALDDFLTDQYRLISIRYITAGVTFTATAGVDALYVECVGGGGAGGGAATGATNGAAGGGGGAGGYSAEWVTTMQSPFTVSIGVGGTGASANDGGNGGNTSFGSPALCTGGGGGGGIKGTVAAPPTLGGSGGTGGVSASGDINVDGHPGHWGIAVAAAQVAGGTGGSSFFGGGGWARVNSTADGTAASGYGSGGAGATIVSGGANKTGGAGSSGVIRVWEYQTTGAPA